MFNKVENISGNISRRNFVKTIPAVTAIGSIGAMTDGCVGNKKMKYVTLGRTGMKSSQFLGDRMPDLVMYRLAIAAGVNYWHKFGTWIEPNPYEIFRKLDRDSFYCDTTVASLDKEKAIQIFEKALTTTGLEYIDGFKIHSQFRTPEEIKTKTGAYEAFEQLKKQGKTRYLMMSQHRNTSEILEAAVESDRFDLIQVPVNPVVPRDYLTDEVFSQRAKDQYFSSIKKASDKGIAITAMKVMMFGPKFWNETPDLKERVKDYLPDDGSIATALIKWTLNVPGVIAFGNMVSSFEELKQNLEAIGGKFSENEIKGVKKFAECMGGNYCRMCGACENANPGGIAVSDILRFRGYAIGYGDIENARKLYASLPDNSKITPGEKLTDYEKACPYGLPVAKLLKDAGGILI